MSRQNTILEKGYLDPSIASMLYTKLKDETMWEEGIRSRRGFTRKAKAVEWDDLDPLLRDILINGFEKLKLNVSVHGVYMNYYENGEMYTPNHRHEGTIQMVLSLGATRTLTIGKRDFDLENGDLVVFGSSVHGVPKDPTVTEGRISIATFMTKL